MTEIPPHKQAEAFTREFVRRDHNERTNWRSAAPADSISGESWVENPWGWVIFFGVIGAMTVGMPTKTISGGVFGAVLFGSPPAILAFFVRGGRIRFGLPRRLGPWPAWSLAGAVLGALAGVGFAGSIGAIDAPALILLRGIAVFSAMFCIVLTVVRLFLGLIIKKPKVTASSDLPRRMR